MRCPNCAHHQPNRFGLVCHQCKYRYALDPRLFNGVSDRQVHFAAARVRGDGDQWITINTVASVISRKRRPYWFGRLQATSDRMFQTTRSAVLSYHEAHPIRGLIVDPELHAPATSSWPEPDLTLYGAERILVVDDRVLVDLLVRNWVHSNGRAVILSADGYPASVLGLARQLVAERSDVPINVLHGSATRPGELIARVRYLLGLGDDRVVLDLGLPEAAGKQIAYLKPLRRLANIPADCLPLGLLTAGLVGTLTTVPEDQIDDGTGNDSLSWLVVADSWLHERDDYG
jgi:hypothetical protein